MLAPRNAALDPVVLEPEPEAEAEPDPAELGVDFALLLVIFWVLKLPEGEPPAVTGAEPVADDPGADAAVAGVEVKPGKGVLPLAPAVNNEASMPFPMVEVVTQLDELGMVYGASGVTVVPTV